MRPLRCSRIHAQPHGDTPPSTPPAPQVLLGLVLLSCGGGESFHPGFGDVVAVARTTTETRRPSPRKPMYVRSMLAQIGNPWCSETVDLARKLNHPGKNMRPIRNYGDRSHLGKSEPGKKCSLITVLLAGLAGLFWGSSIRTVGGESEIAPTLASGVTNLPADGSPTCPKPDKSAVWWRPNTKLFRRRIHSCGIADNHQKP